MNTIIILILVVAVVSLFLNAGYIIHELGWYPHTKDRKSPSEKFSSLSSPLLSGKTISHDYQVMDGWTYDLRKLGHKEIYSIQDPYEALENVIRRYTENPTRSRYDDLVHLSNYVSNHIKADEKINAIIDRISEITLTQPFKK